MRQRYLYRDGEWVEAEKAAPRHRSYVFSDHLDGVYNPMTRKRYDSKSRYEADTKAAGGIIIGNDQSMQLPRLKRSSREIGEALSTAWDKVEAGYHRR